MKFRTLSLFLALAGSGLVGCQRQEPTKEASTPQPSGQTEDKKEQEPSRLAEAIDAYTQAQNPENDAAVRKAMAQVDGEMAELEDLVAKRHGRDREKVAARMRKLEAYRSEQITRFAAVQAGSALTPRPDGQF